MGDIMQISNEEMMDSLDEAILEMLVLKYVKNGDKRMELSMRRQLAKFLIDKTKREAKKRLRLIKS